MKTPGQPAESLWRIWGDQQNDLKAAIGFLLPVTIFGEESNHR
jgi:hypothetical protein